MDPQATLDQAARAYREDDFEESFELLGNYFDWRRSGGFEPRGGDKKAKELLDKLVCATGGADSGWGDAEDYEEGYENPIQRLKVTATTSAKAKTKARKFGRIMDIQQQGAGKYMVTVDQPKMGNPGFSVMPWLDSNKKERWNALTDADLREDIAVLREDIRRNKGNIKKLGKRPTLQQMVVYGDLRELMEDNEHIQQEIYAVKAILEARKADRQMKREAKKPPKAAVMRRRRGVVSKANPSSVRSLVAKALK